MNEEEDETDSDKVEVEAEEPVKRDLEIHDAFVLGGNFTFLSKQVPIITKSEKLVRVAFLQRWIEYKMF